jgi:hypothetical protein
MPKMPTIPAKAEGAGIGSLRAAKIIPTNKPVRSGLTYSNTSIALLFTKLAIDAIVK